MDDLVQWLGEILDTDEEWARDAAQRYGAVWTVDAGMSSVVSNTGADVVTEPDTPLDHIAEYDPARALREIDAKRRIMECHESWVASNGDIICGRCGREHIDGRPGGHFPCQTLRLLALPYADRPGYREEWRP